MCKYSDSMKCWSKCKNIRYRRCMMIHRWCKYYEYYWLNMFYFMGQSQRPSAYCVLYRLWMSTTIGLAFFTLFYFMRINFLYFFFTFLWFNQQHISHFHSCTVWIFVYESIFQRAIICNKRRNKKQKTKKIVVWKKKNIERSLFALSFRFA